MFRKSEAIYIVGAVFIFVITAIMSSGFLHPDEHYQVLELLNLKLPDRVINKSIFNWDYHQTIRSWMQPFIYYVVVYPFKSMDGFFLATLIRLFNGLLGAWGLFLFLSTQHSNSKPIKNLLLLSLIWFVPFLLVRTNSESLSASLFMIGYYHYIKERYPVGMLFWGLAFLIRYQMALLIAPIIVVDLLAKRVGFASMIKMVLVLVVILAGGLLVDFWGYGYWVNAPYNYFYQNLILNKASTFGTDPFYFYLLTPLLKGIPPISLFILYFGAIGLWRANNRSLVWGVAFFTLIHSIIPHKEVRFLTPIYLILAAYAIGYYQQNFHKKDILALTITVSMLVMIRTSLFPAHSRISLYKKAYGQKFTSIYVPTNSTKFEFSMPFYMNRKITTNFLDSNHLPNTYTLLTSNFQEFQEIRQKKALCRLDYSQYPIWIDKLNFFNWLERSSFHAIWSCKQGQGQAI
jgi:GPI mannosyltransferase 3